MPTTRMGGLKHKTGREETTYKRIKAESKMEQQAETNGCADGPTSVAVTNHSDSTQGGKPSEKQVIKPATPSSLQEGRSTRHTASSNRLKRNASVTTPHSTKTVSSDKRTTRHSPPMPASSTNEKRPMKNSISSPHKENTVNKRTSSLHNVSQSLQTTSSSSSSFSNTVVDSSTKSNKHQCHSSPSISKRRLKRVIISEPDNSVTRMSKRIRLQYQPFQSPPPPTVIPSILRNSPKPTEDKIVVFNKGEFLAVRNENGTFFVCRTAQNVYKSSRRFKIQWLNNDDKDVYIPDFYDYTDFECVLTNLRMKRTDKNKYVLPSEEWKRTMNILQRALNVENGMDIPDPHQVTMDGVDVSIVGNKEEEALIQQQQQKYLKTEQGNRTNRVKSRGRPRKTLSGTRKSLRSSHIELTKQRTEASKRKLQSRALAKAKIRAKQGVRNTESSVRQRRPPSVLVTRKAEKLLPNPDIKVFEKDPTFESSIAIPFVSTLADSKLLIRAVLTKDFKLLTSLLSNKDQICSLNMPRSVDVPYTALSYAVMREDHRMIKKLLSAKLKKYAPIPDNLLSYQGTGSYDMTTLGHAVRPLAVSRGGREGNNAFLKDSHMYSFIEYPTVNNEIIELALQHGVSAETVNVIVGSTNTGTTTLVKPSEMSPVFRHIAVAVRHGHSKLAAHLIGQAVEHGGYGYSALHRNVLLNSKEDFTKTKVASIVKKSLDGPRITPLHCAAINPNSHHLETLLYKSSEYSLPDKDGWQPIHYAAVCETTSALEVLLSRDISYEEVTDNAGTTPLHAACIAGRVHNVDLLLSHSSEHSRTGRKDSLSSSEKFGVGGVDRPDKKSYCCIHIAAEKGYCDIVKVLIRHGANILKTTSAVHDKLTAMMLAAQHGHLDVVKVLVENGSPVEAKDKRLRTALTHAIINGHAHVASYLLWLGADKNTKDSSGNTLIHYAAAYGWYFCLKLLIEAGANPNTLNDWKMTPLSLSFLKGHMGLVDVLLAEPGVNINVPVDDEKGTTLMMKTVQSRITPSMLERLKFLVVRQKSDCNVTDYFGNNVLHHFVHSEISELKLLDESAKKVDAVGYSTSSELNHTEENEINMEEKMTEFFQEEIRKEHDTIVKEIADLLLEHGCDPKLVNREGESPFSLTIREGCMLLVEIFMNAGCELTLGVCMSSKNTVLHTLVQYAQQKEVTPLLKLIMRNNNQTDNSNHSLLSEMTKMYNKDGFTPLLLAVNNMKQCDLVTADRMLKLIEFMINELGADVQAPVKNAEGQAIGTILHLAAKCKAPEIFDILLPHNPLLDALDSEKLTPLLLCIKFGDGDSAAKLIRGGCSVNIKSENDDNRSPLILAARNGSLGSVVQLLLQHKADPRDVDLKNGFTALHYVVNQRPSDVLETVKALIAAGASINAVNNDQQTPLHLAVNSHISGADAFYDLEEHLLTCGAKTDACDQHGRIPLHYAFINLNWPDCSAQIDPIELVALLTNAMGSTSPDIADNYGQTPLHRAAYRGAAVSCLHLSLKMKNIDARDKDGNTPLALAVMNGHKSCALALLQKGCSCTAEMVSLPQKDLSDKVDQPWVWHHLQGKPPQVVKYPIIQEAAQRDWEEIVFLMLDQLENVGKGYTVAVEAALKTAKYHLALKLIPKVKHSWTLYSEKQSPFHILARQPESDLQIKVAQALIDKGVPLMAKDEHGCSVTIYSAIKWNASLLSFICDKVGILASIQADPDKSLRTPVSALFWQLGGSDISPEIRSFFVNMIKEGANPNILTRYPLCEMPYPGVRCTILEKLHEENSSAPQYSPLMVAIYQQNFDVVKLLLKHGANVNFCDDQQRTPVMHAAKLNDIKMVKLLLNHSYDPLKDRYPYSEKSLKSFKKTSPADLSLKDNRGLTVVHHAISPFPEFLHVHTTLLKLLAQVGAPLDTANNLGETPLQLALRNQAENMVETLQDLLNVAPEKREKLHIKFPSPGGIVLDLGIPPWDYRQDSKVLQETYGVRSLVQKSCNPDSESGMVDTGEIVIDERKIPYDVLMVNVDLKYGAYGLYNFYKMQLIRHKNRDFYILFTRWGRVGGLGQYQKTPFHKLEEAVKEFCDIFRKKSGNLWDNVQNFQHQPKKYNLVSLEKREHVQQKDIKINIANNVPSKLPACLEKLLKNLMDVHMLTEALNGMGCVSGTPFGTISENSLKQAEEILKTASDVVTEIEKLEVSTKTRDSYDELAKKILELSEQFYRLVPLYGYQYEQMVLLSQKSEIWRQMNVIHDLMHINLSGDLLLGAQYRNKEINPADYVYKCLGCQMELLDRNSIEAQLILQYINNTSDFLYPEVEAIFSVFQERESANAKELNNHMMLWHGTKVSNLLGILKRGLQVAPIGASHSGCAFGKGIYFADMFAKSHPYCTRSSSNDSKYMLLCEVALGNMKEVDTCTEPSKEADSIKVLGSQLPSPPYSISWNGCTWPVGPSVHVWDEDGSDESRSGFLHFNEYVVPRSSQVCIRYLIQFHN